MVTNLIKPVIFAVFAFLVSQFSFTAETGLSLEQEQLLQQLPIDQQSSIRLKIQQANELNQEIGDIQKEAITVTSRPKVKILSAEEKEEQRIRAYSLIYGYDLFASSPTTFAPATNIPIPSDYVLGPGDVLSINVIGGSIPNRQLEIPVERSGSISLPSMKPIGIGGLKFDEAREIINERLNTEFIGSSATITIKELRSMQIFVLGDSYMPGSYTVSSLATISNALYISGGVSEKGSLRNIQLKRDGKLIKKYDLYDLLLRGDTSKDVRLLPGDVIFIPIIKKKVRLQGAIRRPALYELKENEKISDVIELGAGLTSESLPKASELNRVNRGDGVREITNIDTESEEVLSMLVQDGDIINIPSITDLSEVNVELSGQFKFPGTYSVRNGEKLSDLIKRCGGFTQSAYLYGAVFTRLSVADMENSSYQKTADDMETAIASAVIAGRINSEGIREVGGFISRLRDARSPGRLIVDIDPINLEADPEKDFYLENGDRIHIPIRKNSVTVVGDVFQPSTLPFRNSFKTKDYIEKSGGYRWGADRGSVFMVQPDGQARAVKGGIWRRNRSDIAPGSTIVVPKSTRPFDWLILAESITPILSNLATSAAALAVLDD